jgi:hypothetical protein
MGPLDLTKAPPRSAYVQIGGLYMLARTVDKLRATLPGGKTGEYHIDGFSKRLLDALGIAEDDLCGVVALAQSDEDVVAWVHKHSDASKYDQLNEALVTRTVAGALERNPDFSKKYPLAASVPGDTPLFKLMDMDDAEMFPTPV